MVFFKISDREIIENVNDGLKLRVKTSNGIVANPDININVTNLNRDANTGILYKHFHNNGYGGIIFQLEIVIKYITDEKGVVIEDVYNGKPVIEVLHNWIKNMTPLYVKTDAINIPNDTYIITNNSNRNQTYPNTTEWTLEFTTYAPIKTIKYKNNNTDIKTAIKNAKKLNNKSKTKNASLKKCNLKNLAYKKRNGCCTLLNKELTRKGFLKTAIYKGLVHNKTINLYSTITVNAVKRFQIYYNKKVKPKKKLKQNGKMDKATLTALINFKQ